MRITPLDIRKQEFRKVMRGVDAEEVYAFLTTVAEEYEAALSDNKALRERVLELDDKVQEYRTMERTLRDTLLTAERASADAKQNAQREADIIIKEAQLEAEKTLRDIKSRMLKLRQEVQTLQRERENYMARMKILADSFVKFLDSEERHFDKDEADEAGRMADLERGEVSTSSIDAKEELPVEEEVLVDPPAEKMIHGGPASGKAPASPPATAVSNTAPDERTVETPPSPPEETPAAVPHEPLNQNTPANDPSSESSSSQAEPREHTDAASSEKPAVPDLNAILDRMVKEQKEILNESSDRQAPQTEQPAASEEPRKEWSLEQLKKDIISE
jgi:cell division initiation protein